MLFLEWMISRVYWETDYCSVASACILHYELVKYCNCSVVHTLNVNIYLIRPTGLKSDKGFAGNKMRLMNVSIKISFKRFELIHRQSLISKRKGFSHFRTVFTRFTFSFTSVEPFHCLPSVWRIEWNLMEVELVARVIKHIYYWIKTSSFFEIRLVCISTHQTHEKRKHSHPKYRWLFDLIVF